MKSAKPFVNVATICEKVLIEKDNVLSAIRIFDVLNVSSASMPPDTAIPLTALIMLRAGEFRGEAEISIAIETPDGKRHPIPQKWPLLFEEQSAGGNLVINFPLAVRHIGLSWVEVLCNGELLTKFPIKLQVGTTPAAPAALN
jgi:hypothetical protein